MQLTPALHALGWNDELAQGLGAPPPEDALLARIVEVQRTRVRADDGEQVHGVAFPRAERWSQLLTTGDWIVARRSGSHADPGWYLERVVPRRNGLRRLAAGSEVAEQWLAANLDAVFLVLACDAGFSRARAERYQALLQQSGIAPLFVLTKADLHPSPEAFLRELPTGVPALAIDARRAAEHPLLREQLGPGRSVALLGTSGVGKSTLVNALLGSAAQATGAVRARDARGRHTTTVRQLLRVPGGGVLLDTPGIRELALAADDAAADSGFADIDALAVDCRFADCGHGNEPGCALTAAMADGNLDPRRLANWRKLRAERLVQPRVTGRPARPRR